MWKGITHSNLPNSRTFGYQWWIPVVFTLLVVIISGCNSFPYEPTSTLPIPTKAEVTQQPTGTRQHHPTTTITAATNLMTATSTDPPVYNLCSPLAEHSLQELPEIVSSPYDPPPLGKDDRHQGVDFAYYNRGERASIDGEAVHAILPGRVVVATGDRLPYGNLIILETSLEDLPPDIVSYLEMEAGESVYHLYAHLIEAPSFAVGVWVECGGQLGQVGATGYNIPIAHLHLETRIGLAGSQLGTMAFYDTQATEDEMNAYTLWRMSGKFRHFDPMVILTAPDFKSDDEP